MLWSPGNLQSLWCDALGNRSAAEVLQHAVDRAFPADSSATVLATSS